MYCIYLCCILVIFPSNIFGFGDSKSTVTDEDYYQMPDLFHLDNYVKCLSMSENVFCEGVFELSSPKPSRVYDVIRIISQNHVRNFNHTKIHRGICLGPHGSCPLDNKKSWKENFKNCVQNITKITHDLNTNLIEFNGCKNRDYRRPWDFYDTMFLAYIILVIGLNFIGTYYDVYRKKDTTGNPWLICFSLKANWKRFSYVDSPDGEYKSLNCFNAMRGILVPMVLFAHIPLAMIQYTANPKDVEDIIGSPAMKFVASGTISMQIFIITSTFLQTFQMLVANDLRRITFKTILALIVDRYIRLSPMFLTAVGFVATLGPHINDGALWTTTVEKEAAQCRNTFWKKVFLMQHWYAPECLSQTWYLATSFQIFIICALLIYYLMNTKTDIIRTLINLFILNQIIVYAVVYMNELKLSAQYMNPEALLTLFITDKTFLLLYQSLWGNLSSGLLGVLAAYVYYQMRKNKIDLKDSRPLRLALNLSVPLIFLNVIGGCFVGSTVTSRWLIALYATLDKPIFSINVIFFIFGCLFEVDDRYKRITDWSGWKYISRLSLGSLLFHTVHTKNQTGTLLALQTFSKTNVATTWIANLVLTFFLALPLILMVEYPFISLWKTFIASKKASGTKEKVEVNGKIHGDDSSTKSS